MNQIYMALYNVMAEVGAVKKTGWNDFNKFNFRGVDAVVNAVYPALVKHKVIVQPKVLSSEYATIEVGQGAGRKPMGQARLIVEYTFTSAEDGSSTVASAAGEAFDSGDKATAKAMSVALRTALLQSLMLPTDEVDPDTHSYERAPEQDPVIAARMAVAEAWKANRPGDFNADVVAQDFMAWAQGELLGNATADRLYQYADSLKGEATA